MSKINKENNESKSESISLGNDPIINKKNGHEISFSIGLSAISEESGNKKESENSLEREGLIKNDTINNNNININVPNSDYTLSFGNIANITMEEQNEWLKDSQIEMENTVSKVKFNPEEDSKSSLLIKYREENKFLKEQLALGNNKIKQALNEKEEFESYPEDNIKEIDGKIQLYLNEIKRLNYKKEKIIENKNE